jgi:HTH-type transcriptional regulator/antitoxin HipB
MDYPLRVTEQLREHIKALRRKRGLTQAQLGLKLGVGQARIAEIERTPGAISVDQLTRLLSALGASLVLRDTDLSETPRDIKPNKGSW